METGELLAILVGLLSLQVGGFALFGLWRRRRQGGDGVAGSQARASVAHGPSATIQPNDDGGSPPGWSGPRDFVVQRKVHESADRSICSFYLAPLDGGPLPRFRPGQFLTFTLDVPRRDGGGTEPLTRCYSLSDAPGRDTYRVSIKRAPAPPDRPELPPGRGSGHFHDRIEEGDRLAVRAPAGRFFLQQEGDTPVVLIAGGIGITPMLSMLGWLLERGDKREVRLFYGVRNGAEVAMGAQLRQWARDHGRFHLHRCFSAPAPEDRLGEEFDHAGRVDLALLRNILPLRRQQFYLCGPQPMMESLVPGLESWGVEPEDIRYEAFGPASIQRATPAGVDAETPPALITFRDSDRAIPWDPAVGSLLEFAEANGVEVTSGCRAGSCGGCQTRLRAGRVAYAHPPDFEPEPGHCLLCISSPQGAITLEA